MAVINARSWGVLPALVCGQGPGPGVPAGLGAAALPALPSSPDGGALAAGERTSPVGTLWA